jgi:choice-of-anchor A domain-containing protein
MTVPIGTPWSFGAEWSVIARNDARLGPTQIYGALAAGRDVRVGNSGGEVASSGGVVAANSQGTYGPMLGTTSKVGLLAGRKIVISGRGEAMVNQGASAIVADMSNLAVLPDGGVTCVVPGYAFTCINATVKLQGGGNIVQGHPFDFEAAFDAYLKTSTALAGLPGACANAVNAQLLDQNGSGPWAGSGNFVLRLTPGRTNVLNLTEDQLQAWSSFNNNGSDRPNATTPLIINVTSSDQNVSFVSPNWIQGDDARFVLWNFPGALYLTFSNALWGSLFAPRASFVMTADVRGVAVVDTFEGRGGVADWDKRPQVVISCTREV